VIRQVPKFVRLDIGSQNYEKCSVSLVDLQDIQKQKAISTSKSLELRHYEIEVPIVAGKQIMVNQKAIICPMKECRQVEPTSYSVRQIDIDSCSDAV